jgi:hypothetical protein
MVQVTGELDVDVADFGLELLRECDLAADDFVLWRTTSIEPLGWRRRRTASGRQADDILQRRPALGILAQRAAELRAKVDTIRSGSSRGCPLISRSARLASGCTSPATP